MQLRHDHRVDGVASSIISQFALRMIIINKNKMSFLFGSRTKDTPTDPEHMNVRQLHDRLQRLAEENQQLRDSFDDERQTALSTKKFLGTLSIPPSTF